MALRSKFVSGRPRTYDCKKIFPGLKKIVKHPATKYGFDTPLWTSAKIHSVIKSELKLKISARSVRRLLQEIGLSYQKPEKRVFEQDKEIRKIWIEETWPRIKRKATQERAVVLFIDECSVSLNPNSGKTWAPLGKTPVIKVSSSRSSIPVISAISMTGRLYFTVPNGRVNADEFIKFIRKIVKQIPRKKVYLVVDNCAAHKAKKTTKFIEKTGRLSLHFLPPYSPDFNPDELVWAQLKQVDLAGHQARDKDELRNKTRSKLHSLQKRRRLTKKFVKPMS